MNKKRILDTCIGICEEKLADLGKELDHLKESAASDTKSSAGDKYETGREMITQEKEKLAGMQEQQAMHLRMLNTIDPEKQVSSVQLGALVRTSTGIYFLAAGLGQVKEGDDTYFVISQAAPIAQAMLGKKAGDQCFFKGRTIELLEVS